MLPPAPTPPEAILEPLAPPAPPAADKLTKLPPFTPVAVKEAVVAEPLAPTAGL